MRLDTHSDPGRTSYTILCVTWFSVNYNKTHKSQLKYKIKYHLYKISPEKLKFWTFEVS